MHMYLELPGITNDKLRTTVLLHKSQHGFTIHSITEEQELRTVQKLVIVPVVQGLYDKAGFSHLY